MYDCDFCSLPARWSYPAKDFIFRTGPIDHGSKGGLKKTLRKEYGQTIRLTVQRH